MKSLFDANVPAPLAEFLRRHIVAPADQARWQGLQNGALLSAAEREFRSAAHVRSEHPLSAEPGGPQIGAAAIAAAIDLVKTGEVVPIDVSLL